MVEMMVTTAMLVVGLAVLLVSLVQSSILNRIVSDRTLAVTHAQYVLEAIRNVASSQSYTAAATGINNGQWNLDGTALTNQNITALSNETIATSYNNDVNGLTNSNILNVTVTVTWDQRRANETTASSNITLVTLIGNPSP